MKRSVSLWVGGLLLGALIAVSGCASTPTAAETDAFGAEGARRL